MKTLIIERLEDKKTLERWNPLRPHPIQYKFIHSRARFNIVPAGRRSGKTEIAKRRLILRALFTRRKNANYFACAPSREQAKRIYWKDFKVMIPKQAMLTEPYETELKILLKNGNSIYVLGMDKPERIEGSPWDGGILDEMGNMKPNAFDEHVRPALADRKGWLDIIGVPEGRNHYYDLYKRAKSGQFKDAAVFEWPSSDILSEDEILSAKSVLDELTFKQEYEGKFVSFKGSAYYNYSEKNLLKIEYDPDYPLVFCFDWNVDPGVAVVCQERRIYGVPSTCVIDEVYIERNSNTIKVCQELASRYHGHSHSILIYGDVTGRARGSAKIFGSDWDLVKSELIKYFDESQLIFNIPNVNPPERSRILAVNSRLKSVLGIRRLYINPVKAPYTVRDFEGVLIDPKTNKIDKKSDHFLTHLTDALGYYIVYEFPISDLKTTIAEVRT